MVSVGFYYLPLYSQTLSSFIAKTFFNILKILFAQKLVKYLNLQINFALMSFNDLQIRVYLLTLALLLSKFNSYLNRREIIVD